VKEDLHVAGWFFPFFLFSSNGGAPPVVPCKGNGRAIAQDYWDRTFDLQRQWLAEVFLEFFPSPIL
jgi:hypothetical protein